MFAERNSNMKGKVIKYPAQPPKKRRRKFVLCFFLCFLCAGAFLCFGQTFSFLETRNELQKLEARRDALQTENEQLQEEILLLQNDDYIEMQARKLLGMVKPGEIIFHVDN